MSSILAIVSEIDRSSSSSSSPLATLLRDTKKKKKGQKLSLAGPLNKPILIGPNIELNHPYVVLTNQLTAYLAIKLPSPSCSFVTSLFPVSNEWQRQPSKVGNYGSFSIGG